jgi:hypothetical protein
MLGHAHDISSFDATANSLKRQPELLQFEAACSETKQVVEQLWQRREPSPCTQGFRIAYGNPVVQRRPQCRTKTPAPLRASKKSEGWREREESSAAGTAPRMFDRSVNEPTLVRC